MEQFTPTRHFQIVIKVKYDEFDECPSADFREDLKENIKRCIEEYALLEDPAGMSIVEAWSAEVEDLGEELSAD